MDAVITYDVSDKQSDVKKEMLARGYMDHWSVTDKTTKKKTTYYLPYTTLWKKVDDLATALADIQAVAQKLKVKLERAIALPADLWWAIPGEPHGP